MVIVEGLHFVSVRTCKDYTVVQFSVKKKKLHYNLENFLMQKSGKFLNIEEMALLFIYVTAIF